MPKRIVFVPRWKNEVILERLEKKGTLTSARLKGLGVLAVNLPALAEYLTDHEEVEEIYIAYHPRNHEERRTMRPDQQLGHIADRYVDRLRKPLKKLWAQVGLKSDRGRIIERLINRLQSNQMGDQTLQVIAKCMRQDRPEKPGPGSHIFRALSRLAIAELEKANDKEIQKLVQDLKELFRLDRDELLVGWHRVMRILSAVDLDLLALERLLQGENGASESKSAEYLKLMFTERSTAQGAPGFMDMAHFVKSQTEDLSIKWGRSVDTRKLDVIVGFLERLGQLESAGEVEPGLAARLVEEAKGEGRYHDCVWALSKYFAELAG